MASLNDFTRAYLTAALWTSDPNPGSGEWFEHDEYCIANIEEKSLLYAIDECALFMERNRADLEQAGTDKQNGHDFWLSRNGHGTGFFDRPYAAEVCDHLQMSARGFGESFVYLGEDKRIYIS